MEFSGLRAWLLQIGEPLPLGSDTRKMRTALLADKLVSRGHRVFWWASAFEHQRKAWIAKSNELIRLEPGYSILAMKGVGYKKNVSLLRYVDHRLLARKFRSYAGSCAAPNIIVASTPCYHLAFEGVRFALRNGVPVIVDIRDLWPDIIMEHFHGEFKKRLARFAFRRDSRKLVYLLENASGLAAISNGCLKWGLQKINRSAGKWDRVFYHGYHQSSLKSEGFERQYARVVSGKTVFTYVGTFGESYELGLVLRAAEQLCNEGNKDVVFVIAGAGQQFEQLSALSAVLPNVAVSGWLTAEEISSLLAMSHVGLVPCKSVVNAAPNKVFEYLSAGLPLISSLQGEIAEMIETNGIGVSYASGDFEAFYKAVKLLAANSTMREEMGRKASVAFESFGDAGRIYDRYVDFVEECVRHHGIGRVNDAGA